MATHRQRPPVQLTGRLYEHVSGLMRGEGIPKEVQERVDKFAHETQASAHLAEIRQRAGITQEKMATALGVTQSSISKLEAGKDEDITLKQICEYARVTDQRIGIMLGKPFSAAEAVRVHANGLKYWLDQLAAIANENPERQSEIKGLLGDTFVNLFNIIALCNDKLPVSDTDSIQEIRLEIISGKAGSLVSTRLTRQEVKA
jgi:transcriptional regulator with XRE-family HTH domain